MSCIRIHTIFPCSWNKRVSWWNYGDFSYHALFLLIVVVLSCYADPQDSPICYEALHKGSTLTTFKRTECRDGTNAHRFESALAFSISELLTAMNHDHPYDGDVPSNVVPRTVRESSPPTARMLESPDTTRTDEERSTRSPDKVESTPSSVTPTATYTTGDYPDTTKTTDDKTTNLTITDVLQTKRNDGRETTKLRVPPVNSTSPSRVRSPDITKTTVGELTKLIPSVEFTSSTPNATLTSQETKSYYIFDIISDNNTNVTSPNFPSHYVNDMSFWVSIRPPHRLSRVNLTFISFDVEYSPNCTADSLLILGTGNPNPILCGSTVPSSIVSLGNIMELYFKSDPKTTRTGFEAVIQFLDPDPDYRTPGPGICGSIFVQPNSTTVLKSPNNGSSYYRNIRCGYNVHADEGKVIMLSFHWIDLEDCAKRDENYDFAPELSSYDIPDVILGVEHDIDVESCFCDSLQIFDGFDAKAPNLTDRLCSYEDPNVTPISTGNVMHIYLETDNAVRRPGFSVYLSVP